MWTILEVSISMKFIKVSLSQEAQIKVDKYNESCDTYEFESPEKFKSRDQFETRQQFVEQSRDRHLIESRDTRKVRPDQGAQSARVQMIGGWP